MLFLSASSNDKVVVNLGNVWCVYVAICEFGDVLLRHILGVQGLMASIFDETPRRRVHRVRSPSSALVPRVQYNAE